MPGNRRCSGRETAAFAARSALIFRLVGIGRVTLLIKLPVLQPGRRLQPRGQLWTLVVDGLSASLPAFSPSA